MEEVVERPSWDQTFAFLDTIDGSGPIHAVAQRVDHDNQVQSCLAHPRIVIDNVSTTTEGCFGTPPEWGYAFNAFPRTRESRTFYC